MPSQKESNANERLTHLLRRKCGPECLRVLRIRWGLENVVEVALQLDHTGYHQPLGSFVVLLNPQCHLKPPTSCFDDEVVDAIGEAFACGEIARRKND